MKEVNTQNFGIVIAFLIPGFIVLAGASLVSETVAGWIGFSGQETSIGGFLYSTLFALGAGIIASTVRWLIIDTLHHYTGIRAPAWDYSKLQKNAGAFDLLKQDHYRFYQFYANSMVALAAAWLCWRSTMGWRIYWADLALILLEGVCYLGSRDTLRKYYDRVHTALGCRHS